MKPILLHICCAPCSAYTVDILKKEFEITGYFYNPNIYPANEYTMRSTELKKFSRQIDLKIIEDNYDSKRWYALTKGYEKEKEGGDRCKICFEMRLQKCAEFAKKTGIKHFTTVLTVSPQKNAQVINNIGTKIAKTMGLTFHEADFKKKDGFKLSVEKSKKHGLKRQNYCGCEFSKR